MAYILNGEFFKHDDLTISWRDPFFDAGIGVFETLRTINGLPMFLSRHLNRIADGVKAIGHEIEIDHEDFNRSIQVLMESMDADEGRIKICFLSAEKELRSLITAEPAPEFSAMGVLRAVTFRKSPFSAGCELPRSKLWNRLPYALARQDAESRGFGDAIFLSPEGHLTEATRANLFFVSGGQLCTPNLEEGILPGVTRAVILELAQKAGISTKEGEFPQSALEQADEAFLTGSFSGIQPISRIESVDMDLAPGPITSQIAKLYDQASRDSIC